MRLVRVEALGLSLPPLGFGCASLGSRVGRRDGARAIDAALAGGVRWFDVAPPYGDGEAETLLGEALRGRRDQAVICTKYGIARPSISTPKRLLRPLARAALGAFPALRARISRARPIGQRAPIDPAGLSASLDESLRRLRSDHVDVLALHEPTVEEVTSAPLIEALVAELARGRVGALSIAGDPAAIRAGIAAGLPLAFAQFPETPFAPAAARLRAAVAGSAGPQFVTHGVFGSGALERLAACDPAILETSGADRARTPSALLLDYAFAANPDGIVITSMYSPAHIAANLAAAARAPVPALADRLAARCTNST